MSHLMKGTIATLLLLVPAIGLSEDLKQPASTVGRPYVGIIPDLAAQVKGMKVRDVIRNGPADRAGVRASDVITRVDTKEIQTFRDFLASTRFFRIGGKVTLVVKREDREMTITIVPVARPAKVEVPPVKRPPAKVAADGTVTFFNHGAEVRGIAIFPDGKRVLSASSREDRVWELATGKDLGQFTAARSLAVAISGDGKRVAIEGFDALTIHDTANNKQLLSINPHGEWDRRFPFRPTVEAMAYSADRSLLATAGSIAKVGGRHGLPGGIVKQATQGGPYTIFRIAPEAWPSATMADIWPPELSAPAANYRMRHFSSFGKLTAANAFFRPACRTRSPRAGIPATSARWRTIPTANTS